MKEYPFAVMELFCGIVDLIDGDTRRIRRFLHIQKRGWIIVLTLGRVKPKYIDYFKEGTER